MRILHVSADDSGGGAGRAAYRIHEAQVASGVDSTMIVLRKGTSDPRVHVAHQAPLIRIYSRIRRQLVALKRRSWQTDNLVLHTFGETGAHLVEQLNASSADILNLHWISRMLSVADIGRLRKPVVWTLHDMWAFCGGEHYASDDATARFRQGYRIDNRPMAEHGPDLNRRTWEAKRMSWAKQRFAVVSPSRWLACCARESMLFADAAVHVIANPVEIPHTWRPLSQDAARAKLGLPANRKLVMMGAMGGTTDKRKGGDLLLETLRLISKRRREQVELLVYGQSGPAPDQRWPCPVHWLGEVRDDQLLALAYASADLMVVPSRQDNLPNAAVEAQACGTPVVAFDVGGLPDIVVHRETGYLARPFDVRDLATGILWALEDAERLKRLRGQSHENAVAKFSPSVISEEYRHLYQGILDRRARIANGS